MSSQDLLTQSRTSDVAIANGVEYLDGLHSQAPNNLLICAQSTEAGESGIRSHSKTLLENSHFIEHLSSQKTWGWYLT